MKIGIFYGSTTGATEDIAKRIGKILNCPVYAIEDVTKQDLEEYDFLILGSSTWGYGEIQADWEYFFDNEGIPKLKDKKVAIFGLGDQEEHYDMFANSIGVMFRILSTSGAEILGFYPVDGYKYGKSTTAVKDNYFYGLPLDEVNQPELTEIRIKNWLTLLKLN